MHPILVRFGPTGVIYSGPLMLFLGALAAIVVLYEIGGITLSQNQVIGALVFLGAAALYFFRKEKTGRLSVLGRRG